MAARSILKNAVADFYKARGGLDLEKSMSFFDDNCCFRIVGTNKLLPFTQTTQTLTQLTAVARGLFDNWDLKGLKTVNAYFDGDVVLVHRLGKVLHRPSKKKFETEMMDKFTFKDGKIIEYLQFVDTYGIADAAGFSPAQSDAAGNPTTTKPKKR